jgi:predicted PurR-regulated permease PerM
VIGVGPNVAARAFVFAVVAALVAVVLGIAWRTFEVVLLVFGGALVAIFLCALGEFVSAATGVRPRLALAISLAGLVVIVGGGLWLLSARLATQFDQLRQTLPDALDHLRATVEQSTWGRVIASYVDAAERSALTPARALPTAATIVEAIVHVGTDTVVALFIGLFVAFDPAVYVRGALRLVPPARRATVRHVLGAVAYTLRWWMLAQGTLMIALGSATAIALWAAGMPVALALGVLTGAFIFVPYIGALTAFLITVSIALATDVRLAIVVTAIYIGIHLLEAYVLAPLLHWNIVALPPALTLTAQTLMFILVGLGGVLLATPLTAAAIAAVSELSVDEPRVASAADAP